MFNVFKRVRLGFLVLAAGLLLPSVLLADANYDALKAQVENLAAQLEDPHLRRFSLPRGTHVVPR